VATDPEFLGLMAETLSDPELVPLMRQLSDPAAMGAMDDERLRFIDHPARKERLQKRIEALMDDERKPRAASWFVTSADGLQIASVFDGNVKESSLGKNFAWRTYFHGGAEDLPEERRPPEVGHISETRVSALYKSSATNAWKVAISTPIVRDGEFLGIVGMSIEMGNIINFQGTAEHQQFAVLVDDRAGEYRGALLQHPLLERIRKEQGRIPDAFSEYKVTLSEDFEDPHFRYRDPLAEDAAGAEYDRAWIVAAAPVMLPVTRGNGHATAEDAPPKTGLVVLVQEDAEAAAAPAHQLAQRLAGDALWALGIVGVVIFSLWFFVVRSLSEGKAPPPGKRPPPRGENTPLAGVETIAAGTEQRK
jgi:hypothetical protein